MNKKVRMGCNDSYFYNPYIDKLLLTPEGQEDDFTRWFNGEITEGELPSSYNGYDRMVRADIRGMQGRKTVFLRSLSLGRRRRRWNICSAIIKRPR